MLPVGARLPTIRQLAADLGLAAGTVARAYHELEVDGVIESRRRHGSFVRGPGRAARSGPGSGGLDAVARAFAVAVRQLGAGQSEALEAVRRAFDQISAAG